MNPDLPGYNDAILELSKLCECEPQPLVLSVGTGAVNFGLMETAKRWYQDSQKRSLFTLQENPTVVEAQLWYEASQPKGVFGDCARSQLLAEYILDQVQERFYHMGFTTYSSRLGHGIPQPEYFIGLIPGDFRFLVVETFHQHFGADEDEPHDMQGFISWLRQLDAEYPFMLRDCYGAMVELLFLQPIENPKELAKRIYRICGDVITENGREANLNSVVQRLQTERRVRLWWD